MTAHSCLSWAPVEEGDVKRISRTVGLKKTLIIFLFNELPQRRMCSLHHHYWRDSRRRAGPDWQLTQTCSPWLTACTAWQLENSLLDRSYVCIYMFHYIWYAFQRSQPINSSIFKYAFLSNVLINLTKTLSAHNLWLQTLYFNSFWCYKCEKFICKHLVLILDFFFSCKILLAV